MVTQQNNLVPIESYWHWLNSMYLICFYGNGAYDVVTKILFGVVIFDTNNSTPFSTKSDGFLIHIEIKPWPFTLFVSNPRLYRLIFSASMWDEECIGTCFDIYTNFKFDLYTNFDLLYLNNSAITERDKFFHNYAHKINI